MSRYNIERNNPNVEHVPHYVHLYVYEVRAESEPLLFEGAYAFGEDFETLGVHDHRITREAVEAIVLAWENSARPSTIPYRLGYGPTVTLQFCTWEFSDEAR